MKILIVFGTRPEAIKMAPVVRALKANAFFKTKVCVTAQHRHMLDQVLNFFNIVPDFDLDVMEPGQSLPHVTSKILQGMHDIYTTWRPDMVLVQGDTTTAFAASLSAYYAQIPIGHVEAGLRTGNKYSPWPEEMNRTLMSHLTDLHFAPTIKAKQNLLAEGIHPQAIHVTSNTVIDALEYTVEQLNSNKAMRLQLAMQFPFLENGKKIILVTGHRRENFGSGFHNICTALTELAKRNDVHIVYPVHLNPAVREPVQKMLSGLKNCTLLEPLEYVPFVFLMLQSYIILTDSGGIQEEAPAMGKPVLIMRDTTERPEAVEAGANKLVGTQSESIIQNTQELLENNTLYAQMAQQRPVYGDGTAAKEIIHILEQYGAGHA